GRKPISSPAVMQAFSNFNTGKPYGDKIKPFNFLLTAHVKAFGHPRDADPERFQLIAPYETDPRKWSALRWIDQYAPEKSYQIRTVGHYGSRHAARVKTYGESLREYEFHSESKCADAQGKPCG